jgi:hypothetical protein
MKSLAKSLLALSALLGLFLLPLHFLATSLGL